MDQIWALWLVVGRANRRDLAPGGGRTKQIIKATAVSREHIRSIGWLHINKESGRSLTCSLITEQLSYCIAVQPSDSQTDFAIKESKS